MRPSVALPTGTEIGLPVPRTVQPALQAFGSTHGDGAHDAIPQLLLHFQNQVRIRELQRFVDMRNVLARKLDVDDGADDLGDLAFSSVGHAVVLTYTAAAPPTISESSFVIAAWRALL